MASFWVNALTDVHHCRVAVVIVIIVGICAADVHASSTPCACRRRAAQEEGKENLQRSRVPAHARHLHGVATSSSVMALEQQLVLHLLARQDAQERLRSDR